MCVFTKSREECSINFERVKNKAKSINPELLSVPSAKYCLIIPKIVITHKMAKTSDIISAIPLNQNNILVNMQSSNLNLMTNYNMIVANMQVIGLN